MFSIFIIILEIYRYGEKKPEKKPYISYCGKLTKGHYAPIRKQQFEQN